MAGAGELLAIAGGVEAAFGIASGIYKYIGDARGAKQDLRALAVQIELAFGSCKELQESLELHHSRPQWTEDRATLAKKCVYQCDSLLKRLTDLFLKKNAKVDPKTIDEDFDPSFWKKASWSFFKPELQNLRLELILVKMDIQTALANRTLSSLRNGHVKPAKADYEKQRQAILKQLLTAKDSDASSRRTRRSSRSPIVSSDTLHDSDDEDVSSVDYSSGDTDSVIGKAEAIEELETLMRNQFEIEQADVESDAKAEALRVEAIKREYQATKVAEAKEYVARMDSVRSGIAQALDEAKVQVAKKESLIDTLLERSQPNFEMDDYLKAALPPELLKQAQAKQASEPVVRTPRRLFARPTRWFSRTRITAIDTEKGHNVQREIAQGRFYGVLVTCHEMQPQNVFGPYEVAELQVDQSTVRELVGNQTRSQILLKTLSILPEVYRVRIRMLTEQLNNHSGDHMWNLVLAHICAPGKLKVSRLRRREQLVQALTVFVIWEEKSRRSGDALDPTTGACPSFLRASPSSDRTQISPNPQPMPIYGQSPYPTPLHPPPLGSQVPMHGHYPPTVYPNYRDPLIFNHPHATHTRSPYYSTGPYPAPTVPSQSHVDVYNADNYTYAPPLSPGLVPSRPPTRPAYTHRHESPYYREGTRSYSEAPRGRRPAPKPNPLTMVIPRTQTGADTEREPERSIIVRDRSSSRDRRVRPAERKAGAVSVGQKVAFRDDASVVEPPKENRVVLHSRGSTSDASKRNQERIAELKQRLQRKDRPIRREHIIVEETYRRRGSSDIDSDIRQRSRSGTGSGSSTGRARLVEVSSKRDEASLIETRVSRTRKRKESAQRAQSGPLDKASHEMDASRDPNDENIYLEGPSTVHVTNEAGVITGSTGNAEARPTSPADSIRSDRSRSPEPPRRREYIYE